MTYLVKDECIKCKYTDCVEVCPVNCFYEGPDMLVINPDECIDCGVCVPECPVDAIVPDNHESIINSEFDWFAYNKEKSSEWPNIDEKKDPHPEESNFKDIPNKVELLK